jgi:hypothetical protein
MRQFDTLEQIADYVDTCVCENFDINGKPEKFDTLTELVATYCDDVAMSRAQFCEVTRLCDTPSIRRLVK